MCHFEFLHFCKAEFNFISTSTAQPQSDVCVHFIRSVRCCYYLPPHRTPMTFPLPLRGHSSFQIYIHRALVGSVNDDTSHCDRFGKSVSLIVSSNVGCKYRFTFQSNLVGHSTPWRHQLMNQNETKRKDTPTPVMKDELIFI